ncbi:MAG TPA: DUF2231 domain-containing protein [Intrasporangium sp.]|uniref:DUF2231 domain-containing protein n=1 Tax=Intrasporangium sp. TaxID=1925024 RepID=UPI002D79F616|nr:DUF2231 domain-containing protein [Intrasporangium sp.]HET7398464.1 DUF2231 domain-containing protein [Intrasporangium sp.]
MFDTISGLPVHILVVHAVVVFAPLAALAAAAYVLRPRWRGILTWPTAVLAVVAGASAVVAAESGEALQRRLTRDAGPAASFDLLRAHVDAGNVAKVLCVALAVVVLTSVFVVHRQAPRRDLPRPLDLATGVLVLVVAAATIYQVFVTGHSGSAAVWSGIG